MDGRTRPIDAASFSPDATRLTILDPSSRTITWRARLDDLASRA
jgi:hypothetical protein